MWESVREVQSLCSVKVSAQYLPKHPLENAMTRIGLDESRKTRPRASVLMPGLFGSVVWASSRDMQSVCECDRVWCKRLVSVLAHMPPPKKERPDWSC